MNPPGHSPHWHFGVLFGVCAVGVWMMVLLLLLTNTFHDPFVDIAGLAVGAAALTTAGSLFVWAQIRGRQ